MFDMFQNSNLFMVYFLTFIRVSGIIHTAPIFSSRAVNVRLRIFISLLIALAVFPSITPIALENTHIVLLFLVILKELLIGIAIGMFGRFLFAGIQFGGQIIGFQMGFSMVNVLDPQTNSQVSIISQFQNMVMILVFLSFGGHRYLIEATAASFTTVPLATFVFPPDSFLYIVNIFSNVFMTAIRFIAPVFIALLFSHTVMGIIGRLVPQINLMIVGFPIQIAGGLSMLIVSMGFFVRIFEKLMYEYLHNIKTFLEMMRV